MSFTRGPWLAKRIKGLGSALAWFEFRSASTLPVPIFNKSTLAIDCAPVCLAPEDARLIAAAPELLEALELVLAMGQPFHSAIETNSDFDGVVDFEKWAADARKVIAKARCED